jgi:type VI secretion system protein ImpH
LRRAGTWPEVTQFFQLCRRIDASHGNPAPLGSTESPANDPVRFLPWPGLGFPSSELAAAPPDDESTVAGRRVLTRFLGLYGVDAAVPAHVPDAIAQRQEGHEALAAFLDQFNHRLAVLLYRAWRKRRHVETYAEGADEMSSYLLALAGYGMGDKLRRIGLPSGAALSVAAALAQRTRHPAGLRHVVSSTLPGMGVEVETFVPAWVDVPTARLGEAGAPALRGSAVLGRRLRSRCERVRICLVPADHSRAVTLLPGGASHARLLSVLRLYLGVHMDADLRMRLPADTPRARLGAPSGRLGLTTLLGAPGSAATVPLGRYHAIPPRSDQ